MFPIFKHQEEELSQARDELNKLREDETKLEREVRNNDFIKWEKMLCFLFLTVAHRGHGTYIFISRDNLGIIAIIFNLSRDKLLWYRAI